MRHKFIRYLEPLWGNWRFFLPAIIYPINDGLFGVISVYIFKSITYFIERGQEDLIYMWLRWYILYIILYYIIDRVWAKIWYFPSWNEVKGYLQQRYIAKYITLDNNITEKIGTGRFVAIVERGIQIWAETVSKLWFEGGAHIVTIIFSLVLVYQTNSTVFFYACGGIVGIIYLIMYLDRFALQHRHKRREWEHANTNHTIKMIMSKFEVLQSGKIAHEITKLLSYIQQAEIYNGKAGNYVHSEVLLPGFLMNVVKVGLILSVGVGVIHGNYTYADFVAMSGIVLVIESAVYRLAVLFKNTTKNLTYIYKIFDTFDEAPSIPGYNEGAVFHYKQGDIQLQDVTYGYTDETIFSHFSLTIQGGKKTALVGISGSGKSTLVKLIAGYLHTNEGAVVVDGQYLPGGHNHASVGLYSYYQHIGYLTQEPMVFDGTLWENLMYACEETGHGVVEGNDDVLMKKVYEALVAAKCEFIYDFPQGLQTEIGERGVRLSGGQRQRLAIAKIFLKNPKIIILDEPTSALDSFAEEAITEAMHNLFEGRTVIIIAHRLQTVKHADDIILLEDGQVVERGTHDALVAKGGQYAKMLELQSGF